MKNSIALYTVVFGDYDYLYDDMYFAPNIDYYCFIDDPKIISSKWKIILVQKEENSRMQARYYKCRPDILLPEYDIHIWIDARIKILNQDFITLLLENIKNKDMATFKHPDRHSVYEELEYMIQIKKFDEQTLRRHINYYKDKGFPDNNGLVANGIIIRRNTNRILYFNNFWWNIIQKLGPQDQAAFCFAAWACHIDYNIIDVHIYNNSYFKVLEQHKHPSHY